MSNERDGIIKRVLGAIWEFKLLFGLILLVIGPSLVGHWRYEQLMRNGVLIDAVITHCSSHGSKTPASVYYTYAVEEDGKQRTYHKSRPIYRIYCEGMVDEPIAIRYDPDHATISNVVGNEYSVAQIKWWGIRAVFLLFCALTCIVDEVLYMRK